jgi:predicted RNA binding protein YcfA (HicA-like mRNA interferase family)
MSKESPLEHRDVATALRKMGFTKRKRKSGTSHDQWVKVVNGRLLKVTVDEPKAPFSHDLIKSMASQAGLNSKEFHKACTEKKYIPKLHKKPSEPLPEVKTQVEVPKGKKKTARK